MVQALGLPGLQPTQHQRILGAHWENIGANPVVDGLVVKGRADLKYDYSDGVVAIQTGPGSCIEVYVQAGTTAATTAPSSGTATDFLYVDASGQVNLTRNYSASMGALIDKRVISAGATATTSTVSAYDRNWALPYGASLGVIWHSDENVQNNGYVPTNDSSAYYAQFWLPTDRNIRTVLKANIHAENSMGGNYDLGAGSMLWTWILDGATYETIEGGFDRRNLQYEHTTEFVGARALKAGSHTIEVRRQFQWGQYKPVWHSNAPWSHGGFTVYDAGVAQ